MMNKTIVTIIAIAITANKIATTTPIIVESSLLLAGESIIAVKIVYIRQSISYCSVSFIINNNDVRVFFGQNNIAVLFNCS